MLLARSLRGGLSRAAAPRAAALRRLSDAIAVPTAGSQEKAVGEVIEPEDKASLSRFTGVPVAQMEKRTLKIFQPSPTVVGGTQNTLSWKIQWEDNYTQRWTNPLMGWTSTNDPLSNTHMTMEFSSKEDAIRYAKSNGWGYEVVEMTHENRTIAASGPKKYADNFKRSRMPKKRKWWKGGKGFRKFPELYEPPPPPPPKS